MLLRVVDWNIDTIDVVYKVMYEEFVMPAEEARTLEQPRPPRPPPVNPGAPRLTKDDYFTLLDMRRLKRMHDDELKVCQNVRFRVEHVGLY